MTPGDALRAVARSLRFVREQPANSNAGQAVEAMLAGVGLKKGQPWCAAFVSWCGRSAFGGQWPLPNSGGCAYIGDKAKEMFVEKPEPGDVFLLYYPSLGRFAHIGIVDEVLGDRTVRTWEGNTGAEGQREGWGVFQRTRVLGPRDRFVRWQGNIK